MFIVDIRLKICLVDSAEDEQGAGGLRKRVAVQLQFPG